MTYDFRRARRADLPMLRRWQAEPHVRAWWGDDPLDAGDLADPRCDCRIVSLDGQPFAFMQDYAIQGWEDHPLGSLPPGSRGIDLFIGEPAMIGQGHGPAFIAQRLGEMFAAGVPAVGTDPDPANSRAIAAYARAGFRVIGPACDSAWGRVLPMAVVRDRAEGGWRPSIAGLSG